MTVTASTDNDLARSKYTMSVGVLLIHWQVLLPHGRGLSAVREGARSTLSKSDRAACHPCVRSHHDHGTEAALEVVKHVFSWTQAGPTVVKERAGRRGSRSVVFICCIPPHRSPRNIVHNLRNLAPGGDAMHNPNNVAQYRRLLLM